MERVVPYLLLALYVVLAIAAYELVRYLVVRAVRSRLRRSAWRFIERHQVRIDPFKFGGRMLIRHELSNDVEIQQAIIAAARERSLPLLQVRAMVEDWIDEMAPRFSLATYYKFGYAVARLALRAAYTPYVDEPSLKRVEETVPPEAVRVYVINHRSNFDYVLVSYALAQRIALSWAVGEWARVFPLETLFKAFGAFFIRRKFKEPLYHLVLRRYVQLITKRGVTQGFFPEGMLSRDGAFGEARAGLLDYLVTVKGDPEFRRDIRFIPVGIQFDRVLEDRALIAEKQGRERPPTFFDKLKSLYYVVTHSFSTAALNLARIVFRRPFRQGYAACAFGEPLSLDAWLAANPGILELPKTERQAKVKGLAAELMGRIGAAVPATPVPVVCRALVDGFADPYAEPIPITELRKHVVALRRRLGELRVPLVGSEALAALAARRKGLAADAEEGDRRPEMAAVEGELLENEEAEEVVRLALDVLRRRDVVSIAEGKVKLNPDDRVVIAYYARSLPALPLPAALAAAQVAVAPAPATTPAGAH